MTRILVITNMYPPHHLGGYELSCRDVVDRWRERGHEVTVLTTKMRVPEASDPPGERTQGVRRDLEFYWRDHRLVDPPLWRRLGIERGNQRALRRALRESAPEVVSVWHMGAMSLGLLTTLVEQALPIVYVVCDEWLVYGPAADAWTRMFATLPRLARLARRVTGVPTTAPDLGRSGAFCFVSDAIRQRTEQASRWRPQRSTVVYSGVDRRVFRTPDHAKRAWGWRLMCAGRLDERKGVHVSVEALALLPDIATLEIFGRGDERYRRRLEATATRLGLTDRVRIGLVDRSVLRERYVAADAALFPVIWDEPFGLVPIEAMACGTPVIATGRGGSAEFLRDGLNCLLVPPGDAEELASAVRHLGEDPALRARLIDGGLRTAEELDVDRLADVLEAWHLAAADRFSGGRPPDRPSPLARAASRD